MRFAHFFIDRPRFATVVSLLLLILGGLAYFSLPVTQYPEVAPPTIVVTATYPGATPEILADTVATPLEQEVNGVEGMLYMSSQSTSDGVMSLTITFELGTDLDSAQVLVQNRVAIAEPRLPEEVRRLGVVTQKSSPDLMMVVHLESPDNRYDQLYISNYALLQIRDVLARIDGVGSIRVFGAREYSMRVWLDPERLQVLNLSAGDVVRALRQQNVQVATGTLGQPPNPFATAFQFIVTTQGRFMAPDEFGNVIVLAGDDGRLVRVRDVARVELGARDYVTNSYLDGKPAVAIAVFQRPGSNALATADEIQKTMAELAQDFPTGLAHRIVYNPTEFVAESVHAVYQTIFEASLLVVLVILLFLQSWRAALIPIVAIPVSLIGTFAAMAALGYSLNNLSLFGLVLAIGIVVDDAIVVVENIERKLTEGFSPREAARTSMNEVGSALIATSLVLVAVFIPAAFLGGITGQFFRQFAVTISVATLISTLNSLSLSPALGALLLKAKPAAEGGEGEVSTAPGLLGRFFTGFNRSFAAFNHWYGGRLGGLLRRPLWPVLGFLALIGLTVLLFQRVPGGFIPQQDQGYVIVVVELPKGAALERTDRVVRRATEMILETPGAYRAVAFAGFSGATFSNASNAGAIFVTLKPFAQREAGVSSGALAQTLQRTLGQIQDAAIFVVEPPAVRGLGNGGGFKMMIQDRQGRGLKALEAATWQLVGAANGSPEATRVFSLFSTATPQYYLDIDRTKAEMLQLPVENIFETLEINLGSAYVNDFNLFGRSYRVIAQADAPYRLEAEDIARMRARSETGVMVPLGSVAEVKITTGPDRVVRYNLYPSAEVQGDAAAGHSSGEALARMEQLAQAQLPDGLDYQWTELAYQQRQSGATGLWIFPLSVLFVFLLLSAQYESWSLPLSIIMIVPLCLLFAILGVFLRGFDNNILTQIGLIVLVGLAAKNAILMVEFAKQLENQGRDRWQAGVEAARLRLRPILMTALAFILGVLPLVLASGAGAEMRQALGTAVFSGMLGVTALGLFLTPVFYVVIRSIVLRGTKAKPLAPAEE